MMSILSLPPSAGTEVSTRVPIAKKLRAFGDFLGKRRDVVARLQWATAAIYVFLLFAPFAGFLSPHASELAARAARWEEALFWGVWWPGVILTSMIFGQIWCGLFCPDGAFTETASRYGLHKKPERWLDKASWPVLAFALLTVASELSDAHRSSVGTLAAVGGASLFAIAFGLVFGRGKRIWCRWLCPVASMFSLLARCAVLHFNVDRARWDSAPRGSGAVDCPLLLDVRRLRSNEKCNMCARCSGHRGAVALSLRAPGSEIVTLRDDELRLSDALSVCFVLVGLTFSALHFRDLPWHGAIMSALGTSGDYEWTPGILSIGIGTLVFGGTLAAFLVIAGGGSQTKALRLACAIIPLAGVGLFLGAAEHSLEILAREGVPSGVILPWLRALILLAGAIWSLFFGRSVFSGGGRFAWGEFAIYAGVIAGLALLFQFAPSSI